MYYLTYYSIYLYIYTFTHLLQVTNKDLVHTLEGGVVTWTSQIKAVLDRSHEDAIKQGLNPTPDQEVKFWESQSANLNAIFTQLKSKRMRHVMIFLDQAKSSYCGPFAGLCKEVFAARLEANNNVKFLRTLESVGLYSSSLNPNTSCY